VRGRYDTAVNLVDELHSLIESLDAAGVEYAVCGGIALAIHGRPRFTKDIDLLVRAADLERVESVARGRGFTLEGGRLSFARRTKEKREMLRLSKAEGSGLLTLDLILVGPILEEVWNSRRSLEWQGRKVWAVSREGLMRMKRLAGRPQDLVDLADLLGPGSKVEDG
jgi:hypothetical protein